MAKHVLVAYDGSPQAEAALAFVAEEWPGADLTAVHVIDPVEAGSVAGGALPSGGEEWFEAAKERSAELLSAVREAHGETFDVSTRTEVGRPAATLVDVAEEVDADHVVLGSHGRSGLSRIVLGSVAEAVVRNSPVPVTVVR